MPVSQLFAWRLVSTSASGAELQLPLRPDFVQNEGVVHGGIVTALADTAAVYAILPELPRDQGITSIELKINFLRPVRPEGGQLVARARVVQRGRRVAVCDVDVFQDGTLAAKGLFTYLVTARNP